MHKRTVQFTNRDIRMGCSVFSNGLRPTIYLKIPFSVGNSISRLLQKKYTHIYMTPTYHIIYGSYGYLNMQYVDRSTFPISTKLMVMYDTRESYNL